MESHGGNLNRCYEKIQAYVAKPMSEMTAEGINEFIATCKEELCDVESDVKDAKRRLQALKPKKKKVPQVDEDDVSSESGVDA